MRETYRGVLPFLAADAVRIALLPFPSLALFLGQAPGRCVTPGALTGWCWPMRSIYRRQAGRRAFSG